MKARFHWPPERRWFLAAWASFLVALALPSMRSYDPFIWGPDGETFFGWQCLHWSGLFLWDAVKAALAMRDRLQGYERYYAGLGVCNLVMILSAVSAPVLPHRTGVFRIAGAASAIATVVVLSWFVHDRASASVSSLPGAWAWAASFALLTSAFFRAASALQSPEAPAG